MQKDHISIFAKEDTKKYNEPWKEVFLSIYLFHNIHPPCFFSIIKT